MESSSGNATTESTHNPTDSDLGCGCKNSASSITISVTPTTGGQFDLSVTKNDTIENLKKLISKKLKVPKERICLLHRERQLRDGTVEENQLVDGSRLTLLPSVETGLLAQRPEQSVMQALESLNDSQVNDFLSGKAPLNLTMRLGDHMMLIQLQLSTVTPTSSSGSSSNNSNSSKRSSANRPVPSLTKHLPKPPVSDPLASLTSIVNKSIEENSSSPNKLKDKHLPVKRIGTFSMVEPQKSTLISDTSSRVAEESVQNETDYSASTTSKNEFVHSSMDIDSTVVKSVNESTYKTNACKCDVGSSNRSIGSTTRPTLDTRALAEASRNLTQTLKQLSSEVLTSKSDPVEDVSTTKRRQGAIIESMHHHGKGVYSGTFSGTLNPALQDRFGRPKRDISTIIHILNDLLCATPQYRSNRNNSGNTPTSPEKSVTTQTGSTQTSDTEVTSSSSQTVLSRSSAESLENQATRGKMERLRLIMEERRERRRMARSRPYSRSLPSGGNIRNRTQWSAKSETQRADASNLPMDTTEICTQPEVTPEPVIA